MTTLSEYEGTLLTQPGWQRFAGAGPAYALRQQVAAGEAFTAARDRLVSMDAHHRALTASENYAVFAALTGP